MVKEYLKEYRATLLEEKNAIKSRLKTIKLQMTENSMLLDKLMKNHESDWDELCPINHSADYFEMIENLKSQQNDLDKESEELKFRLQIVKAKLDELDSCILFVKKEEVARKESLDKLFSNDELLKLRILETQEQERQRIARELHDSSVQSLTSMVHKIELCMKLMDSDPIRSKLELSSMSKVIKSVIEEMRQMIYNLRPMSLDDIGFEVTLERELAKIQNSGINIGYSVEGEQLEINPVVSLTILRIIQEACSNAVKHANASLISVKIKYFDDRVFVIVRDNGIGFDPNDTGVNIHKNSGFGLSTMRERVSLLSGDIDIQSKKNKGTKIMVEIPIMKEDN